MCKSKSLNHRHKPSASLGILTNNMIYTTFFVQKSHFFGPRMFGAKDGHCSLDDHNIWLTTCCTWNPQKKADIEIFNLIFSISTAWPDFCSRKTNLELIFSHLSPDLFLPELFAPYLFWKCAPWTLNSEGWLWCCQRVWGLFGHNSHRCDRLLQRKALQRSSLKEWASPRTRSPARSTCFCGPANISHRCHPGHSETIPKKYRFDA